jgi:hypothetical protein
MSIGQGIPVWVTDIRTVDHALDSIKTLLPAVGPATPCGGGSPVAGGVPIWRRPWMHLGRDTYAGDVLSRLGVDNVLGESPAQYPKLGLGQLPEVDLVVLPDEPYQLNQTEGPEAFPGMLSALVSERFLTWYGPAMVDALQALLAAFRAGLIRSR